MRPEVAQAAAFIQEKPQRFDERIVEGATNVSGGQKQRLSIARALVRRPQIYIYDDSFLCRWILRPTPSCARS